MDSENYQNLSKEEKLIFVETELLNNLLKSLTTKEDIIRVIKSFNDDQNKGGIVEKAKKTIALFQDGDDHVNDNIIDKYDIKFLITHKK